MAKGVEVRELDLAVNRVDVFRDGLAFLHGSQKQRPEGSGILRGEAGGGLVEIPGDDIDVAFTYDAEARGEIAERLLKIQADAGMERVRRMQLVMEQAAGGFEFRAETHDHL
jgi:hypothetical protein